MRRVVEWFYRVCSFRLFTEYSGGKMETASLVCMGSIKKPVKKLTYAKKKRRAKRVLHEAVYRAEDVFGPHRFCTYTYGNGDVCGTELISEWDPVKLELIWKHPHNWDVDEEADCPHAGLTIIDDGDMTSGICNHEEVKPLKLDDEGLSFWEFENEEVLRSLPDPNPSREIIDGYMGKHDVVFTREDPFTFAENRFIRFFVKKIGFNPKYALDQCHRAYREGRIRVSLYDRLLNIGNHMRNTGFYHPKAARYHNRNHWVNEVKKVLKEEDAQNWYAETEHTDWELVSRQHEAMLGHMYQ